MDKKIRDYFKRIGRKGGQGCSPKKRAALALSREKKLLKLQALSAS